MAMHRSYASSHKGGMTGAVTRRSCQDQGLLQPAPATIGHIRAPA